MIIDSDGPVKKLWHDDVFRSRRQAAINKHHGNDEPSIIAGDLGMKVVDYIDLRNKLL
jgi:hypothetical protein